MAKRQKYVARFEREKNNCWSLVGGRRAAARVRLERRPKGGAPGAAERTILVHR